MKIEAKKVVSVHYRLTNRTKDGDQIESTFGSQPLEYISGIGMMIPEFERNLDGKSVGDTFDFGIIAAEAYGVKDEGAIVELRKEIFQENGVTPDGLLDIGNALPLADNEGNRFMGTVVAVADEFVTLDFNHPMAGTDLWFTGEVLSIRDAEPIELEHGHVHGPDGHHHH
jgi:FKBP-type peptidyl-prolyl cis-trans isomerase SlyD